MSSSIGHSYGLRDFYNEKTILLTGSTGFLGLVIVEKLLRSFPDIRELLLIIRGKHGKTSRERIADYFNNEVFARLKHESPEALTKVRGLEGDVTHENCGLNQEMVKKVHDEVGVVIHCAATVRFTEPLRNAVTINVKGTLNILRLAKGIQFLRSFVYVSTAFSNCSKLVLEEDIYPHPVPPETLIGLVELLDDETLHQITPALLGGWPNTYTYTKNASENLVYSFRHQMPVSIFRPSIIIATWAEPVPSWVNKYVGPYGYMTTTGLGFNRVVHCSKPNMNSNLVPCDFVANAIIAVAWDIGVERKNGIKIINYTSDKNPVEWFELSVKMLSGYRKAPFTNAIWYPVNIVVINKWCYNVLHFLLQKCPAFFADVPAFLLNKKPVYGPFLKKMDSSLEDVAHFLNNDILLKSENIYAIWNKLSEDDKTLVNFDIRSVNWDVYFEDSMRGIKKYLLKEDMSEEALRRAKAKCFWLFVLHHLIKTGLLATLFYIFKCIYKRIR